jgi:hypothetical protein
VLHPRRLLDGCRQLEARQGWVLTCRIDRLVYTDGWPGEHRKDKIERGKEGSRSDADAEDAGQTRGGAASGRRQTKY